MDGEILDVVTEWSTRSVSDGVSGLYELADADFSGAVTNGTAWAFVLNGRFIGVFDGDIGAFEDDSLTVYTAPDISLPLLYAMQARGGEVRGQYYSNETPLTEIDETLSSGNFVGYVELSENVLSGDYYVVYYGGQSLPVAFVGNNRRRLTGDEAFERAADEVGIYSVVDADVEIIDLPERPETEPADEAGAVVGGAAGDADEADAEPGVESAAADDAEAAATVDADGSEGGSTAPDDDSDDASDEEAESGPDWAMPDAAVGADSAAETTEPDTEAAPEGAPEDGELADDAGDEALQSDEPADEGRSADTETATGADASDAGVEDEDTEPATTADADERERLQRELDDARSAKRDAEAARDRIAEERDDYQAEVERLRDRIESLESEIQRLEAAADESPPEHTLDPADALSGTNLFVRYEDKAAGTLDRAAEGRITADELRDNLRLDHHTEFETAGLQVDGRPFDTFLKQSPEHRFAEWLLTSLTYEIRETDSRAGLSKLYEAIERVDRIDLDGEVSVGEDDPDAETTTASFDVVFRDKMGDPLFVTSLQDSRDPTPASAIESLLERSRSVSQSESSFAAAFVVTTSFFDADAMEVAVDATRGGLFSRSSRRSYVKLSRKSGFHLCLVEARDEDFYLTVPDL
ncbi:DUF7527 domain-containing protein [Haloplanus halobius]|uniref:DUF7527 domain-containing protein n=1 Tax=Haloplanus halobius TaxID=2934938 RepID=UPI00200C8291|nr:hypothetical protein [Haloplanus sp. XH21]